MPATKSHRSGTWARTLLPSSRSACFPSDGQFRSQLLAKELHQCGDILLLRATLATLAAGSIPSTGMFFCTKYCSR